jgi:ankyrin repeat protein
MSRVLKLILMSVLLGALASCQSEKEEDVSGTTNNPQSTTGHTAKLSDQEGALIIAAAEGDTNKVKEMLSQGVSVETRDLDVGLTPLGHAAWFGHIDTSKLLIERGADVNAKKSDGTSVLMLATMRNHQDVAEMLRRAGAK